MTEFTYFPTLPNPPDDPADDVAGMQTNAGSINGIIPVDHIGFNVINGGQHKQITFNQDASYVPIPPVSPPVLFTDTVAGLPQLKFFSGDAAHSANQYVVGVANNTPGSTFLLGGIIVKWFTVTFTGSFQVFTFAGVGVAAFPNNAFAASVTAGSIFTVGYNALGSTSITILHSNAVTAITTAVIVIGN